MGPSTANHSGESPDEINIENKLRLKRKATKKVEKRGRKVGPQEKVKGRNATKLASKNDSTGDVSPY